MNDRGTTTSNGHDELATTPGRSTDREMLPRQWLSGRHSLGGANNGLASAEDISAASFAERTVGRFRFQSAGFGRGGYQAAYQDRLGR